MIKSSDINLKATKKTEKQKWTCNRIKMTKENTFMKRCTIFLAFREIQIKTSVRYYHKSIKMA